VLTLHFRVARSFFQFSRQQRSRLNAAGEIGFDVISFLFFLSLIVA
jgi:hypothetical protein